MTIDIGQLSIGISIISLCSLLLFVIKSSMRLGALELKVDTMWGFQMRRAMAEVVISGVGTKNSPLVISKDALANLDPIKPQLMSWYRESGSTSDVDNLLAIERTFGDRLVDLVCVPCGVSYGACLIIALAVAKGSGIINLRVAMDSEHGGEGSAHDDTRGGV